MLRGLADLAGGVVEQRLLLLRVHVAEQIARLLPVIVVHPVIPMGSHALERERRLGKIRLVVPEPRAVRMIGERAAQIAVSAQLAVAVVAAERAFRGIDRDVVEIDAEPITLCVAIGEQPSLQHFVG